jgi:hypothetical protein
MVRHKYPITVGRAEGPLDNLADASFVPCFGSRVESRGKMINY